nr:NepR family anti-sigma factor [Zhengella mangrovi]
MTDKVDSTVSTAAQATGDAVSRRLRDYYDSVKEEAIPDRFLDLLERLDEADRSSARRTAATENASE